jgi:hypothetical protein
MVATMQVETTMPCADESWPGMIAMPQAEAAQMGPSTVQIEPPVPVMEVA